MNSNSGTSAPKWFTIFAILALVWNLFGVMSFFMQVSMSPEALAQLSEAERALLQSYPDWTYVAFAVAVFGGVLGSLLLLLKKNLAGPVLLLSLIAVVAQMGYSMFITNSYEVYGPGSVIMPILVVAIAIYLVVLAAKAKKNSWTN